MIVDDGFGNLKMYTHKFPRKLVLVDVVDEAFKIRSKKQIGSAAVGTVKE